jgi:hypothetical protein
MPVANIDLLVDEFKKQAALRGALLIEFPIKLIKEVGRGDPLKMQVKLIPVE